MRWLGESIQIDLGPGEVEHGAASKMVDADFVQEHLGEFIPPGARPRNNQQRWQWSVTIGMGVVAVVSGAHIAQACGFLAWLGLGGFAMAADVSQQQVTLVQIQLGQINRDIRDAKRQVCVAQNQKNQAALDSWSRQLQSSRGVYFSITRSWPDVQSCEELLVAGSNG